jgi:predicted GNAT family acetyltransferase
MLVIHDRERKRFEIELEGGARAFADYLLDGERVIFPHTVVPSAHEGRGIGSALAKASLDWARAEALTVVPRCSFYVRYMERHPETRDLLSPRGSAPGAD